MENLNKKQIIMIGIIVLVIVIVVIYYFFNSIKEINYGDLENVENEYIEENNIKLNATETVEETIIVHIAGAVNKEGIVKLKEGERIIDAINQAGGLKEDADLTNINLAYMISDGQKIYIPHIEEEQKNLESIITNESKENTKNTSLININTATVEKLTELPRNRRANCTKNNKL